MKMGKLSLFIVTAFFTFKAPFLMASDDVDPLSNVKVSKSEITKSLQELKKKGAISDADYVKAEKELAGMSDTQLTVLRETAIGMIRNNPDKAVDLFKADKIDTADVKKQIDDLSRPN